MELISDEILLVKERERRKNKRKNKVIFPCTDLQNIFSGVSKRVHQCNSITPLFSSSSCDLKHKDVRNQVLWVNLARNACFSN